MTAQEFQSLMSGIQSMVAALALGVGGVWVLFTFRALRQRVRNDAEIAKLQRENQTWAVIDISIDASQQSLSSDTFRYVSAIVEIRNTGSRSTRLEFKSEGPFQVRKVENTEAGLAYDQGKAIAYTVPLASFPGGAAPAVIVRSGGRERIPFFFRVDSPGLYFLTFDAALSLEEQKTSRAIGAEHATRWVGRKYFVVK